MLLILISFNKNKGWIQKKCHLFLNKWHLLRNNLYVLNVRYCQSVRVKR